MRRVLRVSLARFNIFDTAFVWKTISYRIRQDVIARGEAHVESKFGLPAFSNNISNVTGSGTATVTDTVTFHYDGKEVMKRARTGSVHEVEKTSTLILMRIYASSRETKMTATPIPESTTQQ